MRKFPSKIKAIETKYNGYKFRSRLEARYAVFFDSLGIQYYYEHEGYSLEGLAYLPDFFLPQQNCFVEIKGQEPTEDELEKARLLSIYTGKDTYIFAGNISMPPSEDDITKLRDGGECHTYTFHAPSIWKHLKSEPIGRDSTERIPAAPEFLGLLHRAEDLSIRIQLDPDEDIAIVVKDTYWGFDDLSDYIHRTKERLRFFETFQLTIKDRKEEFIQVIHDDKGWTHEILPGEEYEGQRWHECPLCGQFTISYKTFTSPECIDQEHRQLISDSPRLIAAYEAARQARF